MKEGSKQGDVVRPSGQSASGKASSTSADSISSDEAAVAAAASSSLGGLDDEIQALIKAKNFKGFGHHCQVFFYQDDSLKACRYYRSAYQCLYPNNMGLSDSRFRYNMNELWPGLFVGEGPSNKEKLQLLFHDLTCVYPERKFHRNKIKITQIIALGPPSEKRKLKFYNYMINKNPIEEVPGVYKKYIINYKNPDTSETHKVQVTHFHTIQDFKTFKITEPFLEELRKIILNVSNMIPIFVHCSAGLGRSATFVAAILMVLLNKLIHVSQKSTEGLRAGDASSVPEPLVDFQVLAKNVGAQFFIGHSSVEEKPASKIYTYIWLLFNVIRPGSIQTQDQMCNAIKLAQALCRRLPDSVQIDPAKFDILPILLKMVSSAHLEERMELQTTYDSGIWGSGTSSADGPVGSRSSSPANFDDDDEDAAEEDSAEEGAAAALGGH